MPPKKRALAPPAAETAVKRRRRGEEDAEAAAEPQQKSTEELIGSGDLTIRNSTQSPLLRLPAELRQKIWTLAFGNRTLHPASDRPYGQPGTGRVTFGRCLEEMHDLEIYNLTKLSASADDPEVWEAEHLRHNEVGYGVRWRGLHSCPLCDNPDFCGKPRKRLIEPVCKQMYHEILPIIWKTTTFSFWDVVAYEDFTRGLSPAARLDLVTHVSFALDYRSPKKGWLKAITPRSVAALTSLRGVSIVLSGGEWNLAPVRGKKDDVLKELGTRWKFLPNLIKQFRRWKLEEAWTSAFVCDAGGHGGWDPATGPPPNMSVVARQQLAEVIRAELLTHEPRRAGRSGR
ncbi:hypothetical protein P154DRAFT_534315 [Amniculicola lignicola CBS 123094]|uniref:Uncharacterized protein n=1 Tax=Amniculicola lignicola CBS 123094 TaxID=1392246 RepID=A0A6A5WJ87_9PLEO|nr:hypothetical protein P154DRAFT_534315 [Amniculicola lignicola CBS 123094]